jgi:ribose-phosphate pyrophosphokinase
VSATEVESVSIIGDVAGRNVLMVDDITETAGTLTSAAKLLHQAGAREIYAGVSHALLSDLAIERLRGSVIRELLTTNTTPQRADPGFPVKVLCVAPLLGEAIRRIHSGESVNSLFNVPPPVA